MRKMVRAVSLRGQNAESARMRPLEMSGHCPQVRPVCHVRPAL